MCDRDSGSLAEAEARDPAQWQPASEPEADHRDRGLRVGDSEEPPGSAASAPGLGHVTETSLRCRRRRTADGRHRRARAAAAQAPVVTGTELAESELAAAVAAVPAASGQSGVCQWATVGDIRQYSA